MSARILVIEDNETNLELMVYLLHAFGYDPLTALDGEQGIAMALGQRPDLVVCDMQLPGIDGYGVVRQLKDTAGMATMPVVAVTALAMVGDRDRILAAGFDGYISKPIDPENFVPQIELVLAPHLRARTRQAANADTEKDSATARQPVTGADILVVDDTPANRDLLRSILESSGYRVRMASNVPQAHAMAHTNIPDLVLSDLHMHPEAGTELLSRFQADPRLKAVPVMILSLTSSHARARDDCIARGARRFVHLPMEPQFLLAEIAEVLRDDA